LIYWSTVSTQSAAFGTVKEFARAANQTSPKQARDPRSNHCLQNSGESWKASRQKIRHYHNICDLNVRAKCQHCRTIPFFVGGAAFARRCMILKTGEIYENFIFCAGGCPIKSVSKHVFRRKTSFFLLCTSRLNINLHETAKKFKWPMLTVFACYRLLLNNMGVRHKPDFVRRHHKCQTIKHISDDNSFNRL